MALAVYANKAMDAWVHSAGDEAALDALRKCAAIAVRALEQYGCPERKPSAATLAEGEALLHDYEGMLT